jgi:hypothetical protein
MTLTYDSGEDPRLRFWQRMITRRLGGESTNVYIHCHVHPNFQQYILRECADIRDNGQPLP